MDNIYGIVILSVLAGLLTIYTITSNLMVIIAFRVNKKLHTLSNYCLVSLAVSDLTVGIFLMPMYTVYLLIGYWPLGPVACDIWLSLDYGLCTASVVNLLVIAIDRLLSVTRPLTYRRTTMKIGMMIASAWIISLLIWPPWIFVWPYIDGIRIVPDKECYVQFLVTNFMVTTLLSSLSFYTPVILTTTLYYLLYRKTEQRRLKKKTLTSNTNSNYDLDSYSTFTLPTYQQDSTKDQQDSSPSKRSFTCCLCNKRIAKNKTQDMIDHENGERCSNQADEPEDRISNDSCETPDTIDIENDIRRYPHLQTSCENSAFKTVNGEIIPKTSSREQQPITSVSGLVSADFTSGTFESADTATGLKIRRGSRHNDSRIAKILSATLISLIITNAPYYTTAVIESFCPGSINLILGGMVYWMCYLNSAVNPILYAVCNVNFQQTFLQFLRCRCR